MVVAVNFNLVCPVLAAVHVKDMAPCSMEEHVMTNITNDLNELD